MKIILTNETNKKRVIIQIQAHSKLSLINLKVLTKVIHKTKQLNNPKTKQKQLVSHSNGR